MQSTQIQNSDEYSTKLIILLMMSASRLYPPCFPHAPKECEAVANPFFKCLSQYSVKASNDDLNAGIVGLEQCHKEMKHYLTCMEAFERKKTPKLLRVSEEP